MSQTGLSFEDAPAGRDPLEAIRETPGLGEYLAAVEARLQETIAGYPGLVGEVAADALAAGGKRLRPLLTFLSSPLGAPLPVAEGVAIELVHMATLVHDDIVDGALVRRGRAAAWTAHGAEPAKAAGDHLFALAFAELSAAGDLDKVSVLADAALALARGEAMQRLQRHDPDTPVDAYLERVALKTARLFEAACLLGGGSAGYGRDLGIAFQIADDILDCAGDTSDTGKIPGTDLRDGTPTLPLILAAQEDADVRAALAGGPLEGMLVRVVATGALDRSRATALDYARRARESLDGVGRREELEALTLVVVDRNG
jgi:geranylgeranyl pyrophosphate synthase